MSYYVSGPGRSYKNYLQTKSFVDDIRWEISQAGQEVIATRDELKRQGFRIAEALEQGTARMSERLEDIDQTLTGGFITLHQDLMSIEAGVNDLGAKFHWGIGRMEDAIGGLGDSLQTLVQIAKTPEQTWAYEQFEVARDACKRELFVEALEYAQRAINGHQSHTGYKLEHRFHLFVGRILRGDFRNKETVNLPDAEAAYLTAYRYARATNAEHAGHALTGAAYAAYCQEAEDKIADAERYLDEAVTLSSRWGETHFLRGKIKLYRGLVEQGLDALERAVRLDPVFAAKADGDGDYRRHHRDVLGRIDRMRRELVDECQHSLEQCVRAVAKCRDLCDQTNAVIATLVEDCSHNAAVTISTLDPTIFAGLSSVLESKAQSFNYHTYLGAYEATKELPNLRERVAGAIAARSHTIRESVQRDLLILCDPAHYVHVHVEGELPGHPSEMKISDDGAITLGIAVGLLGAILFMVNTCKRMGSGVGEETVAFFTAIGGGLLTAIILSVVAYFMVQAYVSTVNARRVESYRSKSETWHGEYRAKREAVARLAKETDARVNQLREELSNIGPALPSPATGREVLPP